MRIARSLAVAVMTVAVAASAQMKESVTVSVVEVPVTVIDSSGNPVRGLTKANFKLYDQGKEVAISSIDTIDFASEKSMSAVSPVNPVARRKFMLLFDLSFAQPSSLARAQKAAREFVDTVVQPRDLVGVSTIDKRGFHLAAAFTTDRKLVAEAIEKPNQARTTDDPLHLGRTGNWVEISDQSSVSGRGNGALGSDNQVALMQSAVRQNQETVRAEVEKQMDFLGDLAKMMRSVPGRKQLIFLSEGFDPRIVAGSDAREDLSYQATVYDSDTERRWGSTSASSALQRMAKEFRGSDVVLHAIDIQGLRVENNMAGEFFNGNDALRLLSEPTGGMVFKNVNKISDDFSRLMRTQEVVYVLVYQAPATKPGRFHDLKVKLVNVPGASAFARAGYSEAGGETQQERAVTNAEVIMNDVPEDDVHIASFAAAFPTSSADMQVPVVIEVKGADLLKEVKGNAADVEVFLYAFDADGTVRDRLYQKIGLDLRKVGDKLRANGLKYYATLALPPGKYAVKALVTIPETTKRGFARTEVDVPAANQIAATPVFVDNDPNWVLVKGTSHDKTNAAYPFDLGGEHFIPAATARTKRFAIFVPNAKPDELTFETNPNVKFLGAAKGAGATALVMEIEKPSPSVDVTVKKGGAAEKLSVKLQ